MSMTIFKHTFCFKVNWKYLDQLRPSWSFLTSCLRRLVVNYLAVYFSLYSTMYKSVKKLVLWASVVFARREIFQWSGTFVQRVTIMKTFLHGVTLNVFILAMNLTIALALTLTLTLNLTLILILALFLILTLNSNFDHSPNQNFVQKCFRAKQTRTLFIFL